MTVQLQLSHAAVASVDRSGHMADILSMPEHLTDALWRVESARLEDHQAAGLLVAGMGGSSIGGALARAALGDRALRPMLMARGYELPPWITPDVTVLCCSYSGNTEETVAVYEASGALGSRRVVATTGGRLAALARADGVPVVPLPGGFQPRAAVAYSLVIAMEIAAICGVSDRLHSEIDVAAAHAERLVEAWGPDGPEDSLAKTLARELNGTVPTIVGAGLTIPITYRWKCQMNENAKLPAFASEIPEMDHNEICGWDSAGSLGPFSAVFLDDCDLHPRVRQRIELTRGLIEAHDAPAYKVETIGTTPTERLLSLVLLGDLVSVYLAVLRGVDPTPIDMIEQLRSALSRG